LGSSNEEPGSCSRESIAEVLHRDCYLDSIMILQELKLISFVFPFLFLFSPALKNRFGSGPGTSHPDDHDDHDATRSSTAVDVFAVGLLH